MNAVVNGMDDDIGALLETMYGNSTLASGDSDFQQEAYKQFCKNLATLEGILKDKGLLSDGQAIEE